MKTATEIEGQIKDLKEQLEKARQRDREARVARLLSALDKSGLSDEEALAMLQAAAQHKGGESV